jgi:hypothetical protein
MSTSEPRIGARRARLRLYDAKALLPFALASLLVACGNPGQTRVAETDETVDKVRSLDQPWPRGSRRRDQ